MANAAELVLEIGGGARRRSPLQRPLLVLPVGDALQEPFWPEGLACNRL